jgi:hypothetical protein
MKNVWPALARRVKSPSFHEGDADEVRGLLVALMRLSPRQAEPILLELATTKGGLLGGDRREIVRATATEVLGALSASPQVAQSLRAFSQARWGLSGDAKAAAASAADHVDARAQDGSG